MLHIDQSSAFRTLELKELNHLNSLTNYINPHHRPKLAYVRVLTILAGLLLSYDLILPFLP